MDNNDNKKLSPEELLKEIKARGLELSDEQLEIITGGAVDFDAIRREANKYIRTRTCHICGGNDLSEVWIPGIHAYNWCYNCNTYV